MIDEQLLRKYIFHVQVLNEHVGAVAETYLEGGYGDIEEVEADMKYSLKKINKVREIEEDILKVLNKN